MRKVLYTIILLLTGVTIWGCNPADVPSVYNLTTNVTPEEGGTVSPASGEFEDGSQVEIRAEASDNYLFDGWRGDLSGSDNPVNITIEADKNITAVFKLREYPLNIKVEGEGSVTEEIVKEKAKDYEHGTQVRLTAEAAENWVFDRWEGDLSGSEKSQTITVEEEKNVTAVFKLKEYTLNIEVDGEGSVSEEIVEEKAKDYEHGTTVRLTAEPSENWVFDSWSGDLSGSDNPTTLTVEEEKNVTAVFKSREYALNITVDGEGEVNADPDKTQFQHGEEATLTAEPADGWRFTEWKGDITDTENPVSLTFDREMNITSVFIPIVDPLLGMGYNHNGQVSGNNTRELSPVSIAYEVKSVAAGAWHTLFIDQDNVLWGLGYNYHGQLGDGTTTDRHEPVKIASDVAEISAGEHHSLFVKSDGTLWAMGENDMGQLGDGTTTGRTAPVQIDAGVESVAAGQSHSLYIKTDGTLWAMGNNNDGQLGDNTTTSYESPVQVASDVEKVAAGQRHTLFIDTGGSLWAMGGNGSGQLGDGTRTGRSSPVEVASDVSYIAAGRDHSLFVKMDNMLWGMGNNERGQLGDGTQENRLEPIEIQAEVTSTKAGNRHTLFIKTDGTLWAVGKNSDGQLGDGTMDDRLEPLQVDSEVTDIAAGVHHSLYIKD